MRMLKVKVKIWKKHFLCLSPCEQSKQGGSKFNLKKESTHPLTWCQRIWKNLFVTTFYLNYLKTGKIEWAEFFLGYLFQKVNLSAKYFCYMCLLFGWHVSCNWKCCCGSCFYAKSTTKILVTYDDSQSLGHSHLLWKNKFTLSIISINETIKHKPLKSLWLIW